MPDYISKDLIVEQVKLGSGGYGSVHPGVYKGKPCAVKKYHEMLLDSIETKKEKEYRTSYFENEVNILKGIDHPYIVQYLYHYEEWSERRLQLLVMERLHGSLDNWLMAKKPLNEYKVLSNIASALEFIHDKGIVHGDVNHTNILLSEDASVAKLADFGCAQLLRNSETISLGNPTFMPPFTSIDAKKIENCKKNKEAEGSDSKDTDSSVSENDKLSPKIDIFSFGLVSLTVYFGSVPEPDIEGRIEDSQVIPETERRATLIKAVQLLMPPDIYRFAVKCIDSDYDERPCAKDFPTSKSYSSVSAEEMNTSVSPMETSTRPEIVEDHAQPRSLGKNKV